LTFISSLSSKCTRLEIHTLTPEGLQPFLDIGIYGRISTLQLFRPSTEDKDLLFIATERYKFCILAYDSNTGEIVTRANGDIHDATGKPAEHAQIGIIDPESQVIALHLYTGWLKLIQIDSSGKLQDAYNIRYFSSHFSPITQNDHHDGRRLIRIFGCCFMFSLDWMNCM
jgi:DNA damage-binding protein 1